MPYIVTASKWPSDKTNEAVEVFAEMTKKYPPDESLGTMLVQSAVKSTKKGIKSLTVMEVKEGKLEAAVARSAEMMQMFHKVVGYESSIDVWLTVEEALAAMGASMPE